ncbi:hypothetical protein ACFLYS_03365 [Chloroflexota bacterium]
MKNKAKSLILVCGLLVLVISLSACGYVSTPGDGIIAIPHSTDWGFTNCLVCHSDAALDTHADFTLELCSTPACHPLMSELSTFTPTYTPPPTTTFIPPTTTTTGTPPTTTTEPPTTTTGGTAGPLSAETHGAIVDSSLCFMCHGPGLPNPNPEDHADYTNDSCLDAGCHELSE